MVRSDVIYLVKEESTDHGIFDIRVTEEYSKTKTYTLGSHCVHNGKAYKCISAISTPEEWNDNHWSLDPKAYAEINRMVYCTIKSVRYNEFYTALSAGIDPSIIFVLSDYSEYDGEKVVIWNDVRYKVVRTYQIDQTIEITVEEVTNDK